VYELKVQSREEKDSRYIQEASAPAAVTLYSSDRKVMGHVIGSDL
jgi:hypothetical protein